jgi:hypothetical protein
MMKLRNTLLFALSILLLPACKKEDPVVPLPPPVMRTVRYSVNCPDCQSRAIAANGDTLFPFFMGILSHEFEAAVGTRLWLRAWDINGSAIVAVFVNDAIVLGADTAYTGAEITYEGFVQ